MQVVTKRMKDSPDEKEVSNCVGVWIDTVHNVLAGNTSGLTGWFKAYLQSPDFAELTPEDKASQFEDFTELKALLSQLKAMDIEQV